MRTIRQRHMESASNRMGDLRAQYDLTNLKPGTADNAMSFKRDPSFPDFTNPNRIQVITVMFSDDRIRNRSSAAPGRRESRRRSTTRHWRR